MVMRLVFETDDFSEALVVKGLLEQAGFLVQAKGLDHTIFPEVGVLAGFSKQILVHPSDYDDAKSLLDDARAATGGKEKGPG